MPLLPARGRGLEPAPAKAGGEGGHTLCAAFVAAPHPDPLPTEEWGEGDAASPARLSWPSSLPRMAGSMRKRAVTAPLSPVSCVEHLGVVVQPAQQAAVARGDLQGQDLVAWRRAGHRWPRAAPRCPRRSAPRPARAAARPRGDAALGLAARGRVEPVGLVPDLQDRRRRRPPRRCRARPAPPPRRGAAPRSRGGRCRARAG